MNIQHQQINTNTKTTIENTIINKTNNNNNNNTAQKQRKRRPRKSKKRTPDKDPAEKLPQNDPEIPEDIVWRKFIEKAVTQLCFKLIEEDSVSFKFLNFAAQLLQKRHFDNVTEDRATSYMCGYPCCSHSLPKFNLNNKPQYVVDLKAKKLVNTEYQKRFCSESCYKASCEYRDALSEIPSYARDCVDFLKLLYPTLTDEQIAAMHKPIRANPTMQSYIRERSGYNDGTNGPIPKHIAESRIKEKNQHASASPPSSNVSSSDYSSQKQEQENQQTDIPNHDSKDNDFVISKAAGGIEGYVPKSDQYLNQKIQKQQQKVNEQQQQFKKSQLLANQLKSQISVSNKAKYRLNSVTKTTTTPITTTTTSSSFEFSKLYNNGTSSTFNNSTSKNYILNYNMNDENEDEKEIQQNPNKTQEKGKEELSNNSSLTQHDNITDISQDMKDLKINDTSIDQKPKIVSSHVNMDENNNNNNNNSNYTSYSYNSETVEHDDSELWDAYSPVESSEDESEDESMSFFTPPSKQNLNYNSILSSFGTVLMSVQRWHTNHTAMHLNPDCDASSSRDEQESTTNLDQDTIDMSDYYDLYEKHGVHIPHEEKQEIKKQKAMRNLSSESEEQQQEQHHHPMREQRMKHLMEMLEQRTHILVTRLSISSVTKSYLLREIFSLIKTFSLHQAVPGFNSSQWMVVSLLCIHLVAIREPKLNEELSKNQNGVDQVLEQSNCTKEQFDSLISTLKQFY